jgi:hypothetical protein
MTVPFRYIEFYDVPRMIVIRHLGKSLLLQSAFDERTDEYPDQYSVYLLPDQVEEQIEKGSWTFVKTVPLEFIGTIPIRAVNFDRSKRKSLDPSVLNDIMGKVDRRRVARLPGASKRS